MLQINLFRSPLNTQSETIYIEATQKAIKDCLDIDFEYALIYVNGYQVDKDYILKEDDVCTIRQTHGLITSIVTGIQAAVNGRSFKDQWDSNKKDIQKKISDWLAEGNEEPDAPTNKNVDTTTQTIPQLAGAKNASAYGKYVPLVLGRSIYTSNYCGNQYRTISGTDGEKQTFHCLYMLGYKDIQVQDIKLGMTLLSSNPNLRDNGVFQNSEIDGRWDAETYNIQLELEQGSDVSIYPQKVSEEQLNIELLNTGTKKLELNRFSAKNPQTIEIEFTLNGLIGYSENGDEQEKSVQVQIKISFDGGTTYEPFGQIVGTGITYDSSTGVSTITRKKNKVMRFIATRTLTASEALSCENGVAELYIARNNAQAEGNNQFDKIYLSGIRTWCFDPKLSTSSALVAQKPVDSVRTSLTARLGISIEADEIEFKGQLEALNCILTAKGRTYSNGSWSSTLSPTTNPASMALLVLQHPSRGKYAYTDSQIDMDAFGEFYEWCNQPREQGDNTPKFQCNGVMTAKKKTKDYIDAILDCGRGSFLYNSRKISVWIDKPRDIPVMVLNNQNILSQQNNKTLDDLPDGYKCKFVNEITWQTDEWDIIINPNAGANPVYESIDLIFQTNPKQIYQNMMYLYAKNKLRPETWKPRVSVDGNLLDIGSLIEIQNDTLSVGIGDGAEIKELVTDNGYITQIKTDGNMYIDDLTQEYGIKVTCADGVHEPKVMTYKVVPSATGEQSVFTFDTPILESATYKPNVGDIISFGFLDRITTQALCFGKKDNGDGTFDLTLVPYQEGVYTADSGEIPDFKTNVSNVPERDRGSYEPNKDAELLADANQRIYALAQATSHLYSNHIITLYKESTLPLDSTGITGTCTYNFSTNGISWEGSNNGWTLTKPVTNNPVYVTSATAFGKQETDDILPNEWATPIQLGLNGTNGVNTCTLNLYKRLSETPSNYPSTLTYNFLTGSLLGEKNGWSESIPEVDETDNAPCWEIHVTALSTTTTDTIDPSEWTSPAKITQDGYSKEEIMSWIEDVQIESPNIYVNPNTGIFAVDDDGIIQAEQSVTIEVKVIQTNEEIDFDFGAVTVPDGFSIVANNHILTLTAQEGTRVTNSYFTIPIIFTRYESNYEYGDTEGNIYVRLNCQDGQWYGDINSVSNLPAQSNNNYFLWTGIDTTSTEEVVEGGVFKQNTYYYSNGTKFKEASYVPYGMSIPSPTSEVFNSSFGITTVYGGTYHEAKSTVASIPSNPIIGDFFTWTGTDQTSASIVRGGKLLTGCVYKWVGNEWIKDTSAKHRAIAIKEILSVAENKIATNNSDVIDYVRELIAMNVVTENIQVTGEALINSAITAQLTLGKSGETGGFIKSYNYDSTHGFKINADGSAIFREVTIKGNVTADSFTLGESAGITKGTDSSGHSYFGLASDGTLKVRNINAVSGSFTGDITANSFTLGASATIIKGTNTSGHSYFGLASDGTLTVRNINAISGSFLGDITAYKTSSLSTGNLAISMGKNPKNSVDTDISFIIQSYKSKLSNNKEVWCKEFYTKREDEKTNLHFTGKLNIASGLETFGDIYSGVKREIINVTWSGSERILATDNNNRMAIVSTGGRYICLNGSTATDELLLSLGTESNGNINFSLNDRFSDITGGVTDATYFKGYIFFSSMTKIYRMYYRGNIFSPSVIRENCNTFNFKVFGDILAISDYSLVLFDGTNFQVKSGYVGYGVSKFSDDYYTTSSVSDQPHNFEYQSTVYFLDKNFDLVGSKSIIGKSVGSATISGSSTVYSHNGTLFCIAKLSNDNYKAVISNDAGDTWEEKLDFGSSFAFRLFSNNNLVVIKTESEYFYSSDGGVTWTTVDDREYSAGSILGNDFIIKGELYNDVVIQMGCFESSSSWNRNLVLERLRNYNITKSVIQLLGNQ